MGGDSTIPGHNRFEVVSEIVSEVDSYIGWPGQALSHKCGGIEIRSLRRVAQEQMGSRFDLRASTTSCSTRAACPCDCGRS